ncbi:MAG: hypothetical protein ACERKV_08460, partial [Clostridiaceae bacterium]
SIEGTKYETVVHDLLKEHYNLTNSEKAKYILDNFKENIKLIKRVIPIEYENILLKIKTERVS